MRHICYIKYDGAVWVEGWFTCTYVQSDHE